MPKILADKIYEPEDFLEKDGFWSVGDTGWASKGWNGYVWATITNIRYDQSVNLSRYFVETPNCSFWSSSMQEKVPTNGLYYNSYGFQEIDAWG